MLTYNDNAPSMTNEELATWVDSIANFYSVTAPDREGFIVGSMDRKALDESVLRLRNMSALEEQNRVLRGQMVIYLNDMKEFMEKQNKKSFNSESSLLMFRLRFGADVVLFFKIRKLILFFYI